MAEELQSHLDLQAENHRRQGMAPEEARYAAQRTFGGMEQIKERCRDVRGWPWAGQLLQDVRHALRVLAKNPGFAMTATLALALGIGANTATFSVVHGVLLRPLPYPEQERLVVISARNDTQSGLPFSLPNFLDWRARQQSFAALGAVRRPSYSDFGPDGAERVAGAQVTHDYFTALGVGPLRGRLLAAGDDRPGAEPVVVIRESYWQRRFAGRDAAIGAALRLSGTTYTIVGVVSDAVRWPGDVEVWVPLGLLAEHRDFQNRANPVVNVAIGRLKPGVTLQAAQADLGAIARQLAIEHAAANAGRSVAVMPLDEQAFGRVAPMLYLLLGAAGFVLLITCANVANLQLARTHARNREFAVRAALGAGRARLMRQLLVESLLLGLLGCAAGLALGGWALDAFRAFLPTNLPRLAEIELDGGVLAFAMIVSVLTSIVFGLVPALQATRLDLNAALAQGGRGASPAGRRWRAWLIVGQFALTCVLLVGAGLMLRTLHNLYRADLGFSTARVVTFNWGWLPMPLPPYDQTAKRIAAIDLAVARLGAIPGVTHVGAASILPVSTGGNGGLLHIEGTAAKGGEGPWAARAHTVPGLFAALDIPLLAGRNFDARDTVGSPKVAIIDANLAARHFPHGDAVGRRFVYGDQPPASAADWFEVIGVVAATRNPGAGAPARFQTYVPHTQIPGTLLTFTLRTTVPLASLMPSVRAAMREVDPELPVFGESTLDAQFTGGIATQRLTTLLLGSFGALALLLAAIGLYGAINVHVGERRREMAVRLALGAAPRSLARFVTGIGLRLAALGLGFGLLGALGLTRLLTIVLYGVSPLDPLILASVVALLALVGIVAAWLPARRAAQIDPMIALRAE